VARLEAVIALLVALGSVAQTPQDSSVTVHGFLQPADSGRWTLLLPEPVSVAGTRRGILTALGDDAHWSRVQDRFLEVVGRVRMDAGRPVIAVQQLRELDPPGMGRNSVDLSFNQRAIVTLAAIPNRFAWRLSDGQPSGVQPLLMFTVHNESQTTIDFMLPTNDALCVRVERAGGGGAAWQTSLPPPARQGQRVVIRLGTVYQQFVAIPPDAAPVPGRYDAFVTLCGLGDYHAETSFELRGP
jgi:hypothetical protein